MRTYLALLGACSLAPSLTTGQATRTSAGLEPGSFLAAELVCDVAESRSNRGVEFVGDLNGDRMPDLLAWVGLGWDPTAFESWIWTGPDTYSRTHTLSLSSRLSGLSRMHFDLVDVTGDGRLDLAYAESGMAWLHVPAALIVLPGLGDGGFGSGLLIPAVGSNFGSYLVGDCDGDGDDDVLLHELDNELDARDTLAWWSFVDGRFVSGQKLVLESTGFLRSVLDLEGDGIADAVATLSPNLQFIRTVGGVPRLDATLPLPGGSALNKSYHAGDLEGDGDDDLLIVRDDFSAGFLELQPCRNTPAGLVYDVPQSLPNSWSTPTVLRKGGVLVDWDGDGDLDYASSTLAWLENRGSAGFQPGGMLGELTWNADSLQVADLDQDGHPDVIVDWFAFHGDGTFPRRNSAVDPDFLMHDGMPLELRDLEGDGDLDLVARDVRHLNDGAGHFVARTLDRPDLPRPHDHFEDTAAGDFDGDGLEDIVTASIAYPPQFLGMKLLRGTELGGYELAPIIPSSVRMAPAELVGDLDADGDNDILEQNGFWENDGHGSFVTATVPAYAGTPRRTIDLEGDGDLDLLVRSSSPGPNMRLALNRGALVFEEVLLGSMGSAETFLDLDEDGDLDLAVTYPDIDILRLFELDPAGRLLGSIDLPTLGADGPVGQVELDSDDRLDLVVGGKAMGSGTISAWRRGHGMRFENRQVWATGVQVLAWGDLDRDGDLDGFGQVPFLGGGSAKVFENLRFDGLRDGRSVQYGLDATTVGSGGFHPLLGSGGPVRAGSPARLEIARGLGGASGVLLVGPARADVLGSVYRQLVASPVVARSLALGGPAGVAGRGALELRHTVPPDLFGAIRALQVILADPGAPSGISATNGLEVRIGR